MLTEKIIIQECGCKYKIIIDDSSDIIVDCEEIYACEKHRFYENENDYIDLPL